MYHAQFPDRRMPDHRIIQRLHHQLRETLSFHIDRYDASRRRAVPSLSLEESLLVFVADRTESSTRVDAYHRVRALNTTVYLRLPVCGTAMCAVAELHSSSAEQLQTVILHEGFLATDHVILNHGQVTWTTPELAPPLITTTPHQREDVSALERFNVHRDPTRWVFSGTGLELVTRQAMIRYLYHSATAAKAFSSDQG
ncbi:uncharacterized protein TNCV_3938431 [Trichonephila clavipes]|nr:uncharacterized protein TNCV_3938431 [Trichonephila clavipes]